MEIFLFETSRGEAYVELFIKSLDSITTAKVLRTVELLEQYGAKLGLPHSKQLGSGLYELRIRGKVEVRIFYGFYLGKVYLLHAFQKKTQKIPKNEIETARIRLAILQIKT